MHAALVAPVSIGATGSGHFLQRSETRRVVSSRRHRPESLSLASDVPRGHRPRPALLVVDDEPPVLRAVQRDLRGRFGEQYRVLCAGSGAEAEDLMRELRMRGEPLALVLADQRMPGMTGVELLESARDLYPKAKRALLTA